MDIIINYISKIIFSFITVAICVLLIKLTGIAIKRALKTDKSNIKTLTTLSTSFVKYLIYFIGICILLSIWGINTSSIIAIGSVASLSFGIGAQDIIKDMLSGFFILTENQFAVGDIVKIEEYTGTVESIGIRVTRLRGLDGDVYIIPNGQIEIVTNMSKSYNRAVVDVSVSYNEDIDRVILILNERLTEIFENNIITALKNKPKILGINELAQSAVILRIVADCEVGENWNIERQLRKEVLCLFKQRNIEIPYNYLNIVQIQK